MTLWPLFRDLAIETVTAPRSAAERVIQFRPGRDWLWQALLAVVLLNALVFGLDNIVVPPPAPLPPMMATPFLFALTMACGLVITVFGVFWTGAFLGGQGRLDDFLVLVTWMQALRLFAQAVLLPVSLVAPALAVMAAMVVSVMGVWIFINFVDVAHGFNNLLKALGAVLLSGLGIAVGLILMLSIIGTTTEVLSSNV